MATDSLITEIHEDRIQNLERAVNSTNTQLGQHGVKLENIQTQVEDVKVGIERKIDEGFDNLHKEISKTNTALATVATTVQSHAENLKDLNGDKLKRKERSDKVKKAAWAILMLVIGAMAKEGAILFFHWMGH